MFTPEFIPIDLEIFPAMIMMLVILPINIGGFVLEYAAIVAHFISTPLSFITNSPDILISLLPPTNDTVTIFSGIRFMALGMCLYCAFTQKRATIIQAILTKVTLSLSTCATVPDSPLDPEDFVLSLPGGPFPDASIPSPIVISSPVTFFALLVILFGAISEPSAICFGILEAVWRMSVAVPVEEDFIPSIEGSERDTNFDAGDETICEEDEEEEKVKVILEVVQAVTELVDVAHEDLAVDTTVIIEEDTENVIKVELDAGECVASGVVCDDGSKSCPPSSLVSDSIEDGSPELSSDTSPLDHTLTPAPTLPTVSPVASCSTLTFSTGDDFIQFLTRTQASSDASIVTPIETLSPRSDLQRTLTGTALLQVWFGPDWTPPNSAPPPVRSADFDASSVPSLFPDASPSSMPAISVSSSSDASSSSDVSNSDGTLEPDATTMTRKEKQKMRSKQRLQARKKVWAERKSAARAERQAEQQQQQQQQRESSVALSPLVRPTSIPISSSSPSILPGPSVDLKSKSKAALPSSISFSAFLSPRFPSPCLIPSLISLPPDQTAAGATFPPSISFMLLASSEPQPQSKAVTGSISTLVDDFLARKKSRGNQISILGF